MVEIRHIFTIANLKSSFRPSLRKYVNVIAIILEFASLLGIRIYKLSENAAFFRVAQNRTYGCRFKELKSMVIAIFILPGNRIRLPQERELHIGIEMEGEGEVGIGIIYRAISNAIRLEPCHKARKIISFYCSSGTFAIECKEGKAHPVRKVIADVPCIYCNYALYGLRYLINPKRLGIVIRVRLRDYNVTKLYVGESPTSHRILEFEFKNSVSLLFNDAFCSFA